MKCLASLLALAGSPAVIAVTSRLSVEHEAHLEEKRMSRIVSRVPVQNYVDVLVTPGIGWCTDKDSDSCCLWLVGDSAAEAGIDPSRIRSMKVDSVYIGRFLGFRFECFVDGEYHQRDFGYFAMKCDHKWRHRQVYRATQLEFERRGLDGMEDTVGLCLTRSQKDAATDTNRNWGEIYELNSVASFLAYLDDTPDVVDRPLREYQAWQRIQNEIQDDMRASIVERLDVVFPSHQLNTLGSCVDFES